MLKLYEPPESGTEPDEVEVQAVVPTGVFLALNEKIRTRTGEILFATSVDSTQDLAWGNVSLDNVGEVEQFIVEHGGTLRKPASQTNVERQAA